MKKLLITLDINYTKEITNITYPYMKYYANKIDADFKIITERKYPNEPVNIEKFQLYELSKGYDWTIFVDADAIIHPNCPDMTEVCAKDTVIFNGYDLYSVRFKSNNYARRDGRSIGACTWFTVFSDWTRDLWKPYENPKEYLNQISIIHVEKNFGYKPEHILDDYLVSRNIAKYGLKVNRIKDDLFKNWKNIASSTFFTHFYCISEEQKIKHLRDRHNRIQLERIKIG
jgi:hypothetical protein